MTEDLIKYKLCYLQNTISGSEISYKRPLLGSKDYNENNEAAFFNLEDCEAPEIKNSILSDLLQSSAYTKGTLTRMCYYLFTASNKLFYSYPSPASVKESVLISERVSLAIDQTIERMQSENEENISEKKMRRDLERKAKVIIEQMQATITSKCLRFCGWLFSSLLQKLCSSVTIHQGQLNLIKQLAKKKQPIIYLPLHFSHFDYILLSLVSFLCELPAPFVASGDNLNLPLFSFVIKRVGGFFIRRKIDKGQNKKDILYRAVLHSYVTELLRRNQSLEVFIEGTRTRSGCPGKPKTGILSILTSCLDQGHLEDVTVVPINISYDKLIDGNFHKEMMGESKKPESFFGAVRTTFRVLMGFYGNIRINFGNPKSLKKTLEELRSSPNLPLVEMQKNLPQNQNIPMVSANTIENSDEIFNGSVFSKSSKLQENCENYNKLTNEALAEHLLYRSLQCKVFMSTNLLSFLLLHKYRSGVSFPVLVAEFENLVKTVLSRKFDVGFSGEFEDVVLHALKLLGPNLVTISQNSLENKESTQEIEDDLENKNKLELYEYNLQPAKEHSECYNKYIQANLQIPYLFEISYYSNMLNPMFALESIAALSIVAMTGCKYSEIEIQFSDNRDVRINHDQLPVNCSKEFGKSRLVQYMLCLVDTIRFDLILCDITEDLEQHCYEAIDRLLGNSLIVATHPQNGTSRKRNLNDDDIDDYDVNDEFQDEQFQVNLYNIHDFIGTCSVMSPYIEAIVVTSTKLIDLIHTEVNEKLFIRNLIEFSQQRVKTGVSIRPESSSSELIKHAIESFVINKILERSSSNIKLNCEYQNVNSIVDFTNQASKFLM